MLVKDLIKLLSAQNPDAIVLSISGNSDYLVEIDAIHAPAQIPTFYSEFRVTDSSKSPYQQVVQK